jgi:hypothetical protein
MKFLSPRELLEIWERGSRLQPLDQGLLVLSAALPGIQPDEIAGWPLGRRNRALLELHAACIAPQLQAWAECDNCRERMEFEVDTRSFLSTFERSDSQKETVVVNGIAFRLPSSRDLALALQEPDPNQGARRILETCCIGESFVAWSAGDVNAIGEKLAIADPMAEPRLSLTCPACGKEQEESLDLLAFVWSELQALAKRLLRDIHTLASAYGWSEPEILSLSNYRRSKYVELALA